VLFVVLPGIVPTLAWRARVEERVLSSTFGEAFAACSRHTEMLFPGVF
jgi:protein-S-isoprenylcysteine O-methyltransferase Ste14